MAPKAPQLAKNSYVGSDPKRHSLWTTTQSFPHSESPLARSEVSGVTSDLEKAETSCEPVVQKRARATGLVQELTKGCTGAIPRQAVKILK